MAIDKLAWYRRLHLQHEFDMNDIYRRIGLSPVQGPVFMGHDSECEDCSSIRDKSEKNKEFVRSHDIISEPKNLNHGNSCTYCNEAITNEMGRNASFETGSGEGQ